MGLHELIVLVVVIVAIVVAAAVVLIVRPNGTEVHSRQQVEGFPVALETGNSIRADQYRETLGPYRDCPGATMADCPKTFGRGSFDRVV